MQLRQLEERLLDTISAVQGTILDDDTVVQALEDLKGEAGEVAREVGRLDNDPVLVSRLCLSVHPSSVSRIRLSVRRLLENSVRNEVTSVATICFALDPMS